MVSLVDAIACAGSDVGSLTTSLDAERCREAIERECGSGASCVERLREEAFQVASEYERTSSISRSLLKAAFETLRPIEGPRSPAAGNPERLMIRRFCLTRFAGGE
jgi:hypothetical protein